MRPGVRVLGINCRRERRRCCRYTKEGREGHAVTESLDGNQKRFLPESSILSIPKRCDESIRYPPYTNRQPLASSKPRHSTEPNLSWITRFRVAMVLIFCACLANFFTLALAQASETGNFTTLITISLERNSLKPAKIASDGNGHVYISGRAEHFDEESEGTKGFHGEDLGRNDIFIAKVVEETGEVVWTIRTGTTKNDYGQGLAIDPSSDSMYVAGTTFAQFGSFPYKRQGDIFVIKYNIADGQEPTRQWGGPVTFGTSSVEDLSDVTISSSGEFLIIVGITRGTLFGEPPTGGFASNYDAFIVKMKTSDGSIEVGRQFGNAALDAIPKNIVLPRNLKEPILVGVDAIRAVGSSQVENTMIYKFDPASLEPLGSILLRTSATEKLAGIVRHNLFANTTFAGSRSLLSEYEGWNLALKRITQDVQSTVDIGEVSESVIGLQKEPGKIPGQLDYNVRIGSDQDDSAVLTAVDPRSGRIWTGGSTPGIMVPDEAASERFASFSQVVLLAYEPDSGVVSHIAQQQLGGAEDFASLVGFVFSKNGLSITFAATRVEKSTGNNFIEVGSYRIPGDMLIPIPEPDLNPSPSPSPPASEQREIPEEEVSFASVFEEHFVIIMAAGGGGFVVFIIVLLACCAMKKTKAKSAELKFSEKSRKDAKPSKRKAEVQRPPPVVRRPQTEAILREGDNATGLM